MKKILYFIFFFLMLPFLNSCKNNDKILLTGNINNDNLITLENYQLKEKIEDEESFIVLIGLQSCQSCESFKKEVLIPYINNTYADIFYIDAYQLDESDNYNNKPKFKTTPNLQLYKDGKSILRFDYEFISKNFKDAKEFNEYMQDYIINPKIIVSTEEFIDSKIENKESFILYIGWSKCGDCVSINENVFDKYLKNNSNGETIYYLESDKYRKNKPAEKPVLSANPSEEELLQAKYYQDWLDFANKYNFVSYNDGKIPTIQYYDQGKLVDMIVYKNDVIMDGVIVDSFYSEIKNKTLSNEEIEDFHNDKVIEFLDKYYKKTL